MNYVLSPCPLAADGIKRLVNAELLYPEDVISIPESNEQTLLIVYIPEMPDLILTTLRQTISIISRSEGSIKTIILGKSPAGWMRETLKNSIRRTDRLENIYFAPSDLQVIDLSELLNKPVHSSLKLNLLCEEEIYITGRKPEGLSRSELQVISDFINGKAISSQAYMRAVTAKTLYLQKKMGIKNFTEAHPAFLQYFYLSRNDKEKFVPPEITTKKERALIHALRCGKMSFGEREITDGVNVLGVKLYIKWRVDSEGAGSEKKLKGIESKYAWMLITTILIKKAIKMINHHKGTCSFSIGIPKLIAGNERMVFIVKDMLERLEKKAWNRCFSVEIPSDSSVTPDEKLEIFVKSMQDYGIRVVLDDVLSFGGVILPTRKIRFDDYKLGMKTVNDSVNDEHLRILISSLIHYCNLSGSRCIAEGINSHEEMRFVKSMGINIFQCEKTNTSHLHLE